MNLAKGNDQSSPKKALVDHCLKEGLQSDFDAAEILAMANYFTRRLTIEALHIISNDSMNLK